VVALSRSIIGCLFDGNPPLIAICPKFILFLLSAIGCQRGLALLDSMWRSIYKLAALSTLIFYKSPKGHKLAGKSTLQDCTLSFKIINLVK
jgi:hypothetical protein